MSLEIRKPLRRYETPAMTAGNRLEPEYKSRIDEKGVEYLEKVGETDTYAIIQSHKDEADIHNILMRYQNGDMSVMTEHPIYADISNMPKSYAEALNRVQDMQEDFAHLPAKVRAAFDNDFNKFAAQAGTLDWFNKMGLTVKTDKDQTSSAPDNSANVTKQEEKHES